MSNALKNVGNKLILQLILATFRDKYKNLVPYFTVINFVSQDLLISSS